MSNTDTDSFIREVSEEVRQDRLIGYWKKYGPYVIGAIAAVVLASAAVAWLDAAEGQAARDRGELLGQASDAVTGGLSAETVEDLVADVDGTARVIAEMQIAQVRARGGDLDGALTALGVLADDGSLPRRYTDLARLEAARLELSVGRLDSALATLDELVLADSPYRILAIELRAVARLNGGDAEAARADLLSVLTDPFTTPETRSRVQALQSTLPPEVLSVEAPDGTGAEAPALPDGDDAATTAGGE